MKKPFLSVCIPTFNRRAYLQETLAILLRQIVKLQRSDVVEIIISDNNSTDGTERFLRKLEKRYPFVSFFRNAKNIGADKNVIKVASYARGKYIWFLSDDDLPYPSALETIMRELIRNNPDACIINLDLVSKNGKKILAKNLLAIGEDQQLRSRKDLFRFLSTKFMLPVDWYTTCLSNTIVSRKLYRKNVNRVLRLYTSKHNNFLHSGLIYYAKMDLSIYIISERLIRFRADNRSFGPDEDKNKAEYLEYIYRTFSAHNKLIYKHNKIHMSAPFKTLLYLKDFLRLVRIVFFRTFKIDLI